MSKLLQVDVEHEAMKMKSRFGRGSQNVIISSLEEAILGIPACVEGH